MEITYHDTLSPYRFIRQDNAKVPSGYSLNTLTSKQINSTDKLPRKADWYLYMSKHKKRICQMDNEKIPILEKEIEVMEEGLEQYQNELNKVNEEIDLFEEDYCPYLEQDRKNISKKINKLEIALREKREELEKEIREHS